MFAIFVFFCLLHGIVLDVIPIYALVALPIAELVCIVSFFVVFSELLQAPIMPWAADPNDPAKGPKLMLAAFLLAVFVIVIECGAINCINQVLESNREQAPAAWVELTDRFKGLPDLPPEEKASYVVEDEEAGGKYLAVVSDGGAEVQLTYLDADETLGEGENYG